MQVDHFDDTRYLHSFTRRESRRRRGNEELLDSIRRFNHGFSAPIQGEYSKCLHPFPHRKLIWLFRSIQVEDYDVAYVSGVVQLDPESDLPVLERGSFVNPNAQQALPAPETVEELLPQDDSSALVETDKETDSSDPSLLPALKPSLFIGDLRLALLKERLSVLKIPTEFTGEGVLVCGPAPPEAFDYDFATRAAEKGIDSRKGAKAVRDQLLDEAMEESGGKVAVRKVGRGKLVLDGTPGETYFVVRKAVYALHAQAG